MKILETIKDPDGSYSHTKIWANIANASATLAFLYNTYKYPMSAELLGTYVLAVGAQRAFSKYLDGKTLKEASKDATAV